MSIFEGSQSELYWFLLGLALLLSELVLPGFVIMFFGIGAWITALCILLGITENFNAQLLIFLGSSILTLVLFRKKGKKYFQGRISHEVDGDAKLDDFKGARGIVVEDVIPSRPGGKVEVHGTNWNATASTELKKGTAVEVLKRSNLTLTVKPIE